MIPLLITMDLEFACDHDSNGQSTILYKLCDDLKSLKIPSTAFITSEFADKFTEPTKKLIASGNEIGCHGLEHRRNENYRKMEADKINYYISNASKNIENKIQVKPVCFRGPGMSTSTATQEVLIKNGYIADFSVCSQRLDFINSTGGDIRWLFAPRYPYNPSLASPYRKGEMPIRVIPLSSLIFPFMSGTLYLFGLKFMKRFFNLLIKESQKSRKPIVYLFHSYEFTQFTGMQINNGYIDIVGRYNRPILHRLYVSDPIKRYNINMELLKYMLSFKSVRPLTGKKYCDYLSDSTG